MKKRKSHWRNIIKHYMWCFILPLWYSILNRISHWRNSNKHYMCCYILSILFRTGNHSDGTSISITCGALFCQEQEITLTELQKALHLVLYSVSRIFYSVNIKSKPNLYAQQVQTKPMWTASPNQTQLYRRLTKVMWAKSPNQTSIHRKSKPIPWEN